MKHKINVGTIEAYLYHTPEHYNTTCRATIPENWECEINISDAMFEALGGNNRAFEHFSIYGTSQDSAQNAIDDCIQELKNSNLTGKLIIHK